MVAEEIARGSFKNEPEQVLKDLRLRRGWAIEILPKSIERQEDLYYLCTAITNQFPNGWSLPPIRPEEIKSIVQRLLVVLENTKQS
jgi:hypothetical protein